MAKLLEFPSDYDADLAAELAEMQREPVADFTPKPTLPIHYILILASVVFLATAFWMEAGR